jgi:hypothetical protein
MPQLDMADIRALGAIPVSAEQILGLIAENRELKAQVAACQAQHGTAGAAVPVEPGPLVANGTGKREGR